MKTVKFLDALHDLNGRLAGVYALRLLVLGAWAYAAVTLIRLAQRLDALDLLLLYATLLLMLVWFGVLALTLVDRHPRFALFAAAGCVLAAALL